MIVEKTASVAPEQTVRLAPGEEVTFTALFPFPEEEPRPWERVRE